MVKVKQTVQPYSFLPCWLISALFDRSLQNTAFGRINPKHTTSLRKETKLQTPLRERSSAV